MKISVLGSRRKDGKIESTLTNSGVAAPHSSTVKACNRACGGRSGGTERDTTERGFAQGADSSGKYEELVRVDHDTPGFILSLLQEKSAEEKKRHYEEADGRTFG